MNKKPKIKKGTVFNELTVLSYSKRPDNDKYSKYNGQWIKCKCSCGKTIVVPLYCVERGFIKSCGHLKGQQGGENLKKYFKTHGATHGNYLTIEGTTKNISEWSKITGVPRTTILYRLNNNVSLNKLFEKENKNDEAIIGD